MNGTLTMKKKKKNNFILQAWHLTVNNKLVASKLMWVNFEKGGNQEYTFYEKPPRTDGSVSWTLGCYTGGCEFDSSRTNTQGLKITE